MNKLILIIALLFCGSACNKKLVEETSSSDTNKNQEGRLSLGEQGIEAVRQSGIVSMALNVGDTAALFILRNSEDKEVSLKEKLIEGPIILTWYRGGWCPYCNKQLAQLQDYLPRFKETGAHLIALSPELPDESISTKEKHDLEFDVLSDTGNNVAREYGIVFTLIDGVARRYELLFNLSKKNGDESSELPLAATYVIGQDGVIRYAFLNEDYKQRANPEEILTVLKTLNQ